MYVVNAVRHHDIFHRYDAFRATFRAAILGLLFPIQVLANSNKSLTLARISFVCQLLDMMS